MSNDDNPTIADVLIELRFLREEVRGLRELGGTSTQPESRLVSASALAEELNVERNWIYANSALLGAVRLGDGPKPRLRFDIARAREALGANSPTDTTAPPNIRTKQTRRSPKAGSILRSRPSEPR